MGRAGSVGSTPPERDDLRRLPAGVRERLADIPRHLRALRSIAGSVSAERYQQAYQSGDADALARDVYPIERALEILDNYMIEMAEAGVKALGQAPDTSGVANLRTLVENGAVSSSCVERLIDVHRTRNQLIHNYPHVRARMIFDAVEILDKEVVAFMRGYVPWLVEQFRDR